MKKIIILALIVAAIIGYHFYKRSLIPLAPFTYTSQKECEQVTKTKCAALMCDYVPEGKTFEEACGRNFKKGWAPIFSATYPSREECERITMKQCLFLKSSDRGWAPIESAVSQ